jgi:hypothetical protein
MYTKKEPGSSKPSTSSPVIYLIYLSISPTVADVKDCEDIP